MVNNGSQAHTQLGDGQVNKEEALRIIGDIEVIADAGRTPDPNALQALQTRVGSLRGDPAAPGQILEPLNTIESWSEILFNGAVGRLYGTPSLVRHFIHRECAALRETINKNWG